jgi:hypothetical protein
MIFTLKKGDMSFEGCHCSFLLLKLTSLFFDFLVGNTL